LLLAQVSHQLISIKRTSKNLSMSRKLDVWRRIELDVRRRIECVVKRKIECVVRRMIELVNYKKISRRRRMNFWRDEFTEDWNRSTYDVVTRSEKKEKRTRTKKKERRTSASIKRTIFRILSMLSFICNWSHCALNEWEIVYRSFEDLEWLMSWYVRQETHSLVCLHLFKMLTSIHS
jgi:hypothetical protein